MMKLLILQTNKKSAILIFSFFTFTFSFSQTKDSLKIEISEQFFNTTVKIQAFKEGQVNGKKYKISTTGTALVFSFSIDSINIPCLVTNKHVIENCTRGILKFNNTGYDKTPIYGDIVSIELKNFEKLWLKHPTEDLAILFLQPIKDVINNRTGKNPFTISLTEEYIPTLSVEKQFLALEEIIMVGYPKGFSDSVNNIPILRRGVTATPIYLNYNNKRRFLIDIPIFPGSSGSPVFIYNPVSYTDKRGNTHFGKRFSFVGIVADSRNYDAVGESILEEPEKKDKKIETKVSLPMGIAIVIKSSVLLDFEPEIKKTNLKTYSDLFLKSIQ